MTYSLKDMAKDLLAGKLMLTEAELQHERIKVCEQCDAFRRGTRTCALCNCQLDLKTRVLSASCPAEKW